MKIGITLPVVEPGWTRQHLLEWCRRADEGPFSSLAMGERMAFPNPEFIATLSASAVLTRRIRLVATVMVLPLHNPVMAAKQLATIDLFSEGRLSVGLGVGGREEDYLAVSADLSRRRQKALAEDIALMRRVWAGEIVIDGLRRPVEPFPLQPGGPELLAGAMGPKALAAASHWAEGVAGFSFAADVDEIRSSFEQARAAWTEAGRERPPRLITSFWFGLGDGARDQITAHLRRYFNWLPAAEVEAMLPHTGFAGDAAALRERVQRIFELGADELILTPTSLDPAEVDRLADALGPLF